LVTPLPKSSMVVGRSLASEYASAGVVVKSTSGVLGKTFVHLRDGSGNAKSGDHDLTVTTEQTASVGSTMLFEGTVVTDKDFGAGYSYPVLVKTPRR